MSSSGRVVSNTTPLIVLAGVGLLDLLPILYGSIAIPTVVRDEYIAGMKPGEPDISGLPWLQVYPIAVNAATSSSLDRGELAAIELAIALNASGILLDNRDARIEAQRRGLFVTGSIGVLLDAKRRGAIALVAPVLDQMIAQGRLCKREAP